MRSVTGPFGCQTTSGERHRDAPTNEETTALPSWSLVCYWRPFPIYFWKTKHIVAGDDLIEASLP